MAPVLIGTSGFSYPHWRGTFYPPGLRESQLAFYARHFTTVEVNASFYGLPRPGVVQGWLAAVPPQFVFTFKGSRLITHVRRLRAATTGARPPRLAREGLR